MSEWHSVADVTSVVLLGDPSVASIPVDECGEELMPATEDFVLSSLMDGRDPHRSRVREGVYRRLLAAQAHLPAGLRICWVEGHRDPRLQERYFNNYRECLENRHRHLSAEDSYLLASRYVSPPKIAPHVSGAAIDLHPLRPRGQRTRHGHPRQRVAGGL